MFASTVGGGAMTLVFRPAKEKIDGKITAVKVPLSRPMSARKKPRLVKP